MVFRKIKAQKCMKRGTRTDGNYYVFEALINNWDEWRKSMLELTDDEQEMLAEKFEQACDGAGEAVLAEDAKVFLKFYRQLHKRKNDDEDNFIAVLTPEYFVFEE